MPDADSLLVERIRRGESDAWNDLIDRYEGRLLAFIHRRLRDRSSSRSQLITGWSSAR